MIRKIIHIDESKCNGCGLCANACHEGAIDIVEGKAKLIRENFCDGFGDCLPTCPMNAITFEEREAPGYDEQAVLKAKREKKDKLQVTLNDGDAPNALDNWPVQIGLINSYSPEFNNADLLLASDCSAYAYGNFHRDFICGKVTIISCPKQDGDILSDKLTDIIKNNVINSITLVRMFVPCCSGMEFALYSALGQTDIKIPSKIITIGADGKILSEEEVNL